MSSWNDIFKSFFSIPKSPPGGRCDCEDDGGCEEDSDFDKFFSAHDDHDPFPHFGGFSFHFTEPEDMFRHFEEIFKDLGMAEFPPAREGPVGEARVEKPSSSPRDHMLKDGISGSRLPASDSPSKPTQPDRRSIFGNLWKPPHWDRVRPQDKVDREIDVSDPGVLDDIVRASMENRAPSQPGIQPGSQPGIQSSFQSVSVRSVTRPDGSVEEVRTVRDSNGNEETTVTRYNRDQSVRDGQQKTEFFSNLNHGDMRSFSEEFRRNTPADEPDDETKTIFKRLFGFSMPSYGKT